MILDVAAQERGPGIAVELAIGRGDVELAEDLIQGVAVDPGVLADVESAEVEAEHLDEPDDVVEIPGGGELTPVGDQRVPDGAQVGEQLGRLEVSAGRGQLRHVGPRRRSRGSARAGS